MPESVSDLLLVNDPKLGKALFLADASSGAVYIYRWDKQSPARVDFSQFELFAKSQEFPHPVALAYRVGKLIVCDGSVPAVVEIDLNSREERVLLKGPPLLTPGSIAASPTGWLAMTDEHTESITWRDPKGGTRVDPWPFLNDPTRASFDSQDNLIVLDSKLGNIFSFNFSERSGQVTARRDEPLLPESFRDNLKRITDFAQHRGVYYFAGGGQVVAYARSTRSILPHHFKTAKAITASKLAASEDFLAVADETNRTVWLLDRPAPVSVSAEGDSVQFSQALVHLYEYLLGRDMLPRREIDLQRNYDDLEQLLIDHKVVVATKGRERAPNWRASYSARLTKVMCDLNGWDCSVSQSGKGPDPISARLTTGRKVTIPSFSIAYDLTTAPVSLGGRTVRELLADRVSPDQLAKIDAGYLTRINLSRLNTLEAVLVRNRFTPASSPNTNLRPGMIVSLDGGKEVVRGDVSKCGVPIEGRVEMRDFSLPTATTSRDIERSFLMRDNASAASMSKRGIDQVQFDFGKSLVERLDAGTIEPASTVCLSNIEGKNNYVVVEAVKVMGARYVLRRKDGSPYYFSDSDLERFGLSGRSDKEEKWGLIVDDPFYLGYRVVPLEEFVGGRSGQLAPQRASSPSVMPLAGSDDIFSETTGVLNLPITQWRLSVLVNAGDFNNKLSELRKLEQIYPSVSLLSEEEFGVELSAVGILQETPDKIALKAVKDDRERLKNKIKYSPPVERVSEVIIGLGEAGSSVSPNHPDFKDVNGRAVWYQVTEEGLRPVKDSASGTSIASPPIKVFSDDADHGTHVAGLLAARETSAAPGLLPTVGLFLIDTSSAASLKKSIQTARDWGIVIFNFSFTIAGAEVLDPLKKEMENNWYDRLFVVAAGNHGKDLRQTSVQRIPVSWSDDVKNILGVGALDNNDNPLGAFKPDPSALTLLPGTNTSKRHIQLLAPGLQIYSTASNNTYAVATGSSLAVPQVTAAAAMLLAQDVTNPLLIKARLIYTADWFSPQFDDKVWGGELNYRQAVWEPRRNLLVTQSNPDVIKAIVTTGNPIIKLTGGEVDDPRGDQIPAPTELPFSNVLRIQLMAGGRFIVHYLDRANSKLRILRNVESLEGTLTCSEFKQWNGTVFETATCTGGIQVSQIFNYIAKVPVSVKF